MSDNYVGLTYHTEGWSILYHVDSVDAVNYHVTVIDTASNHNLLILVPLADIASFLDGRSFCPYSVMASVLDDQSKIIRLAQQRCDTIISWLDQNVEFHRAAYEKAGK